MAVYLINIILIFVWKDILLKKKESKPKYKKLYCIIIALQWILISGLRHWSVGADTYNYYRAFENGKNTSWSEIFSNCYNYLFHGFKTKDPGYYLLQKLFQVFSDNYQVFLIFIAFVFIGLMAWWIYKNSNMPEISFLIYSTVFYSFYAVTGHRQTIATALIVFIGYELIKEKKYLRFMLVAFIAFMIHKSSIVFIAYMIIANINLSLAYVIIIAVIIIAVAILGNQLYGPIAVMLGFDKEQIEYSEGGAEAYATILLLVCLASFILYHWISKRRTDCKYLYNMMFLVTASILLIYQQQGFMRIQQYFSLIIMVLIPEMILSIKKKYRTIAYYSVVAILVIYIIINQPQYQFFWQEAII